MPDAVDEAIAASTRKMLTIGGQLATGKPFSLTVPDDLNAEDAYWLTEAVHEVRKRLAQERAVRQPVIHTPTGPVLVRPS